MFSYLIGLDLIFIYIHTLCLRAVKALASLCMCAASSEPSLLSHTIRSKSNALAKFESNKHVIIVDESQKCHKHHFIFESSSARIGAYAHSVDPQHFPEGNKSGSTLFKRYHECGFKTKDNAFFYIQSLQYRYGN